jgi:hypothetical protein
MNSDPCARPGPRTCRTDIRASVGRRGKDMSAAGLRGEARGSWRRLPRRPRSRCRCDNQARPLPCVLLRARTPSRADPHVLYARDQQHALPHVTHDVVVVVEERSSTATLVSWYARMCMWIYAAMLTLCVTDPALHVLDTALHAQRLGLALFVSDSGFLGTRARSRARRG